MWSLSRQMTGLAGTTAQTRDKNRYKMTQFISIIMELMLHIIKLSMNLWSAPRLWGCHGATMLTIERIFLMVVLGDQCSAGRVPAQRLDVTTMTVPKHQDSAQSSIKALLASCVEVDSSLTWSLISRPETQDQHFKIFNSLQMHFSHFATNYSIAARILIHSLDLKGQRCMGYGRWKLAS